MTETMGLDAFETLYRRHYRMVRGVVLGFRLPEGAVDDVIQDAFVRAWENLDRLAERDAFGAWVATIARNRCLEELRRRKPTMPLDLGLAVPAADETEALQAEIQVAVARRLLDDDDVEPRRTVARMFYLDEKPVKEIAEALVMNQNTVLSHLRRFRLAATRPAARLVEEHEAALCYG